MSASAKSSFKFKVRTYNPNGEESQLFAQGLQTKNTKLAQDLQNQKLTNAQLINKVVELSQKVLNTATENNRYRQCISRLNTFVKDFVPAILKCSDLVNNIVQEIDRVRAVSPGSQPLSRNRDGFDVSLPLMDGFGDEGVFRSHETTTSLRTGIAKPIVQGHTISKPSVSLQRFHLALPPQCNSMPVRGLHVADILTAADSSAYDRLGDIVEEEEEEEEEEVVEEEEGESDEVIILPADEDGEESAEMTAAVDMAEAAETAEPTEVVVLEAAVGTPLIVAAAQVEADEAMESSDDETVELSLIESRRQLANCSRRKDLKEGTSQDYDDFGEYTPGGSRRRKRNKRNKRTQPCSPRGGFNNGISAARKSVNGLLNSLDTASPKREPARARRNDDSSSENNISPVRMTLPRVNITRLSPENRRSSEGNSDETQILSVNSPSRNGGMIEPLPGADELSDEFLRVRQGLITTRKRSAQTVSPTSSSSDDLTLINLRPHSPKKRRKRPSWAELLRRKSDCDASEEESVTEKVTKRQSPVSRPSAVDAEIGLGNLTVLLNRCSDNSMEDNLARDSVTRENALQISHEERKRSSLKGVTNGSREDRHSSPKYRSKPKARSKPKSLKPKKTANGKSSSSGKSSGSRSELEASTMNTSQFYVPGSRSDSLNTTMDLEVSVGSRGSQIESGRPRRGTAPVSLKEKPLNTKMRRR